MSLFLQLKRLFNRKSHRRAAHEKVQPNNSAHDSEGKQPGLPGSNGSEYVSEQGRVYFNDDGKVKYILPVDTEEADRIHQQHWMLRYIFQGNYEVPLENELKKGITVLDAGCGPATWTLEMSELYPLSTFVGVDVSPVFPESIHPPNCHFQLANLTETLPFPDNHFDYIHLRLLVAGLTVEGWDKTLTELNRVLKPGGWLEMKEIEFKLHSSSPTPEMFMETLHKVMRPKGMNPLIAYELKVMAEKQGLININERIVGVPLNHSGKVGDLFWGNMKETIMALKPVFAKLYPEQYGEESKFMESVNKCAEECAANKTTGNWYCVIAQKPSN